MSAFRITSFACGFLGALLLVLSWCAPAQGQSTTTITTYTCNCKCPGAGNCKITGDSGSKDGCPNCSCVWYIAGGGYYNCQ
jgi:hypothetical protein